MEFFVAKYLKEALSKDTRERLFYTNLPGEILYFLGGFGFEETAIQEKLSHLQKRKITSDSKTAYFKRNISIAQLQCGHKLEGLSITDAVIDGVKVARCELLRCTFDRCRFDKAMFSDVSVYGGRWLDCKWLRSTLLRVRARKVKWEIELVEAEVEAISIQESSLKLAVSGSVIDDSEISDATVEVRGSGAWRNVTFKASSLQAAGEEFVFEKCGFVRSQISSSSAGVTFSECHFTEGDVSLSGDVNCSGSLFKRVSKIGISVSGTGGTRLGECKFDQCQINIYSFVNLPLKPIEGGGILFTKSRIFGLPLASSDLGEGATEKRFQFQDCSGFCLVAPGSVYDTARVRTGGWPRIANLPVLILDELLSDEVVCRKLIEEIGQKWAADINAYVESCRKALSPS
jgi:coenzyme F420-reducing hydrogenase delta subunit